MKKKIVKFYKRTVCFLTAVLFLCCSVLSPSMAKADVAAGGNGRCNLCGCTGTFMLTWLHKPTYNSTGTLLMYCGCKAHPAPGAGYSPENVYNSGGNYGSGDICGQWAVITDSVLALPSALKLNKNGGTGGTDKIYLVYGDSYISTYSKKVINDCERVTSYGTGITSVTVPSKEGYRFAGYYNGTAKIIDKNGNITASNTKFKADAELTAKWTANSYEVVYDANGGTGTMENSEHAYGTEKKLTANAYTKKGYGFNGWNTKKDGTGTAYTNKAAVKNLTSKNNGTVTLYAQWKASKYTVAFDANGGSVETAEKKVTFDSTYGTLPVPERKGFIFKGWYTTASSGNRVKKTTTVSTAKDHTLFAHWSENTYTVTYHANGGTTSAPAGTYHYGDEVSLGVTACKDGYTFVGWATSPDADRPLTSFTMPDLATSENSDYSSDWELTLYALYSIDVSDVANHTYPFYEKIKEDEVSLYVSKESDARSCKKYSLSYKEDTGILYYKYTCSKTDLSPYVGNGGYGLKIVAYDNAGNEGILYKEGIDAAIPKHYWQTVSHHKKANGTWQHFDTVNDYVQEGTTYTPASVTAPAGYRFSHLDTKPYVVTGAKTSNAYYIPEIYTLTFDKNGGDSVSPASRQISYMELYGSMPVPVRRGHTFTGWHTERSGGREVKAEQPYSIAGNSTIYAHWSINSYSVTYDYWTNGGTSSSRMESVSVAYGNNIDVSPQSVTAVKNGWVFLGWNTDPDAESGLSSLKMGNRDVVLYAVYKKDITATFIDGSSRNTRSITTAIHNRETSCRITALPVTAVSGWKILGWSFDTQGNAAVHVSPEAEYEMSEDKIFYACYVQDITIDYDTGGSPQTIPSRTQPRYYNAAGNYSSPVFTIADAPVLDRHSFVAWEELDSTGIPVRQYAPGCTITAEYSMTLLARWDMYPEIEAYDRYFTLEETKNGTITAKRLFEKVSATDKEDGMLKNGTDITIPEINMYDFVNEPEIRITYQAKDSFGNITTKSVMIYIVNTTVNECSIRQYSRFIRPDFYKTDMLLMPHEQGGLEPSSIWISNKTYQHILEHTLESETPVHIYFFSQEELSK